MRTVVVGERPAELQALIERRRSTGADLYDEVWEGDYHMAPARHGSHGWLDRELAVILRPLARRAGLFDTGPFNLGDEHDYRVPDGGLQRSRRPVTWSPTAALVIEIVSPGDETWAKLPFYAAHDVDEIIIVDPMARRFAWLAREGASYIEVDHSAVLDVAVAAVVSQIDWPPVDDD